MLCVVIGALLIASSRSSRSVLFAPACSSSNGAPEDTCAFVADTNNCYRTLLAAVDDCLTDASSDGEVVTGTRSADGT
jgi:hypothetical protein